MINENTNTKIYSALKINQTKQIFSIREIAIERDLIITWAKRYFAEAENELLSDDTMFILTEIINSKECSFYYNYRWRDLTLEELIIEFAKSIELELPTGIGAMDLYLFAEISELCQPYYKQPNNVFDSNQLHLSELEKDRIREKISHLEMMLSLPKLKKSHRWIEDFGTMRYYKWKELFDIDNVEEEIDEEYYQELPAQFLIAANQWIASRKIAINRVGKLWKIQLRAFNSS